ncbi:MAG: PAS domain S-box protein [Geobacteraceae bacterium]|nr:PAS domain S-box protein [Geobacteraceae bacterium]
MKRIVIIDDNGQEFDELERLLTDHGFSVSTPEDDIAVRYMSRPLEQTNQNLFENAPIGILRSTLEGNLISVNPAMARFLKYESPEEMIRVVNRTNIAAAVYVDPDRRQEVVKSAVEHGGWQIFEEMFRCKDGSIITCNFHFRAVPGQTGIPRVFEAFLEDITARKQAEESLNLSQKIIDNASIGIMRGNAEARILSVNDYWTKVLGYTREELCSMSYFDIDPNLTPEFWRTHRQKLTATGFNTFESHHRRKDGTIFPVQISVNYLTFGEQTYSCSFAMDISDRKRTENVITARMRLLQFAVTHTPIELLQAALDEAEKLTGSSIGFYHYVEADQKTLSLQNWSTRTMQEFCTAQGQGFHYDVAEAGVWVDCIHQRRPVIHNDYASLPHRKGLPPGHAPLVRELVVPVFRGDSIVAIFGVGNKPRNYTLQDVETVSLLADLAWGIVEQKRTEAALRESEQKYRSIIEYAPFGIARASREGKLLSANPAMAGILKYDSPDELLETVNRSNVQDALFAEPSLRGPLVDRIFTGNSWQVFENRYRCKDGSFITCKVHARRIIEPDGKESEFESFLENITERLEAEKAMRESEEKFRVLAETSSAAITLFQGEEVIYVNPAAARLLGYTAEELSRTSFWSWVHDDFKEMVRERRLARMRGEAVSSQYECKFVTKDGKELWALMSVGFIEFKGKPAGIVTLIDTTEAKLAEERVRASLAEKEVLLKEVHHRVKNNLQIISSLLDLQSDHMPDEQSRAFISESQNRIRSMALIHQKLYQSHSLAFVDFREYIDELATSLFTTYAKEHHLIQLNLDVGEVTLGMDEAIPCGLIVNELVSNSLKHAFPDGRKGEIRIQCHSGEDGWITLTVTDTGVGLPHGLDFRNTESLGLQLVAMLVRQLKGEVSMEQSEGTTFRIRFFGRRE